MIYADLAIWGNFYFMKALVSRFVHNLKRRVKDKSLKFKFIDCDDIQSAEFMAEGKCCHKMKSILQI